MGRQVIIRDGVELMVETGTASILVDKCQHVVGKRNAEIFLQPDHLKNPIRGWLDTADLNLAGRFKELLTLGGRCAYRIEVSRTNTVDAALPWDQVPQTDRFRRLVGLAMPQNLSQLIGDMNVLASVGAGVAPQAIEAAATETAASRPPAAPSAPPTPKPAPPATGGNPALCAGCNEPIGTRPCRRVGQNWVHTDTPCLEAPFADTPATAPDLEAPEPDAPAGAEPIHRADGTIAGYQTPPPDPAALAAAAKAHALSNGMKYCDACGTAYGGDTSEHEASAVHQGKARQVEQAAELAAARAAKDSLVEQATRFDDHPTPVKPPAVPLPAPKGPRMLEGRPYERFNSDGSMNFGSYAMQANVAAVNWAQRLLVDRARTVAGETGAQASIDPAQLRTLARQLLNLSDRIQASVRDDGRFDRMDNSHSRARSALSTALNVYPVPFAADDETKAKWADDVVAWAVMIINLAAELDA